LTWKTIQAWYLANWPDPQEAHLDLALAIADEATLADPENPLPWSLLGIAQYRRGEHAAAAQSLAKSLSLSNNGDVCTRHFALAKASLGDRKAAIESQSESSHY
jgi:Flp pilus assembly protein TadD